MTHEEFFPFHNRHIVFKLRGGSELSGVLIDPAGETGRSTTMYKYIATSDMVAWKKAERAKDKAKMKRYENRIDIGEIVWAEQFNY
jgi:hypothetical protein